MKCNHLVQWDWNGLRVVVEGRMKGRGDAEKRVTGTQGFRSSEGELEGRGDGGWTRGPLFGPQRGLWWSGALPQPEVLLPWQNQKALLSCSWWGCNWYMFLESCLAANREP